MKLVAEYHEYSSVIKLSSGIPRRKSSNVDRNINTVQWIEFSFGNLSFRERRAGFRAPRRARYLREDPCQTSRRYKSRKHFRQRDPRCFMGWPLLQDRYLDDTRHFQADREAHRT